MKTQKPYAPWLLLWSLLLIAAVAIGLVTRWSYTNVQEDWTALDSLPYLGAAMTADELERHQDAFEGETPQALFQQADVVVVATREGDRRYLHKAFATTMRVSQVVKGDVNLEEAQINLFEPVGIYETPYGRKLVPSDAYLLGGVFIREDVEYALFLQKAPATSGVDGYVMLQSPFAKMPLDDLSYRIIDVTKSDMTLSQVADCDFIIGDEESLNRYRAFKDELRDYIALG